jgi:hypothetical protein
MYKLTISGNFELVKSEEMHELIKAGDTIFVPFKLVEVNYYTLTQIAPGEFMFISSDFNRLSDRIYTSNEQICNIKHELERRIGVKVKYYRYAGDITESFMEI